ncbi:MAG: hypothetical protein V3U78_05380 [Thiotrichaceae bacterium]
MSKDLHKWSKELMRSIDKVLTEMAAKQALFNEFFYEVLEEDQKQLLLKKLEEFDNKKDLSIEEINDILKKATRGEGWDGA